jgi:hypothetical protein
MKFVLELKNKPRKDDILVFNGESFECVSKQSLIKKLELNICDMDISLKNIDFTLEELSKEIRLLKGEE